MKLNTLYKRAVNGKINEWTVEIKGNCFRTISGYTDGVKTTSEWMCCEGKNISKKNETGEIIQIRSSDENIQRILYNLFYDILNIEFNLWVWIRNMCKYGDFYLHLDIAEKFGIFLRMKKVQSLKYGRFLDIG